MITGGRIKRDSPVWPWVLAGVVLAVALGVGAYMFFRDTEQPSPAPSVGFEAMTSWSGPSVSVTLYFPSKDGRYLRPEAREIRETLEKMAQIQEVVDELIRGPRTGLTPSFPPAARVKGIFMDDKGTLYVNFSRELQTEFPGGAWTETLTIYSLVNTLAENFTEVKRVQILVEGNAVETLSGHIDASRPFPPRPALNKE